MSKAQQPAILDYSGKQVMLALVAVFAIYGTSAYFIQALNNARPKIAAELDGMALYSWSISIPSLVGAFVTLIFGKASDMYGRRLMLMISLAFFLVGTILCAISPTFAFLIFGNTVARMGSVNLMMLCYAVLGDLFPPVQRSRWIGMLNIPAGIFALFGPTMGGWFVDNLTWRYLYWIAVPLIIGCLALVPYSIPPLITKVTRKIDFRGCILIMVASSATILGFSFAGTTYSWTSIQVIGLFGIAIIFWILFFRAENSVDEPILDLNLLRNRSFVTVAIATFLSFFAQMGITLFFPLFLQGIQGVSATKSGTIITPYSVLFAFVGVPVGFLLAKTKRYKWMYIVGFGILTADMFGVVFFTTNTPIAWSVIACVLAGLGLGAIPTVNTMVVQNAVPKRLLGVAMGAIFFIISMGMAVSPAILGAAWNATYSIELASKLPEDLKDVADAKTMTVLGNSRVLLSQPAMEALEKDFARRGNEGRVLFSRTVAAIRLSMEASIRSIFWIAAVTMLISFLLIITVPEISLDSGVQDKEVNTPTAASEAATAAE
jgi:MFS family permease